MKKEFIKMIENMTDEAFVRVLDECVCPKHYGLGEYRELCEDDKNNCIDCWREALNCKETKNTLKTWEMIRELERNPNKKFIGVRNDGFGIDVVAFISNGYMNFEKINDQSKIKNIYIDRTWEEVKQPVTWHEAIQAWVDGKEVMCILNGAALEYAPSNFQMADQYKVGISYREIKEGTWYILDEVE